jgi:TusA-related sulfurtransferase
MRREEKTKMELDLRGVAGPRSGAPAKVRLETLGRGAALVVWLDDPKGVRDLPRAAEAEGYAVDEPESDQRGWRVTIHV